jgi:hypothetical protein
MRNLHRRFDALSGRRKLQLVVFTVIPLQACSVLLLEHDHPFLSTAVFFFLLAVLAHRMYWVEYEFRM